MSKEFENLSDFILNKMKMSHVYQPVMLIEIFKNNGSANVRNIARSLLGYDISQVSTMNISQNMVGKVLATAEYNFKEKTTIILMIMKV